MGKPIKGAIGEAESARGCAAITPENAERHLADEIVETNATTAMSISAARTSVGRDAMEFPFWQVFVLPRRR